MENKMQITSGRGVSWFGSGRDRHSVEYNEVIAKESGVVISFRRYPNTTVIQYETDKHGRKHKITSKMENHLFNTEDVLEIFLLLGIATGVNDRLEIVERLKSGWVPNRTIYPSGWKPKF